MSRQTHRMRDFTPLRDKTLNNVLLQLFATEFGFRDKMLFAQAMVERILDTIEQFVRPLSWVKPGQLLWMAVANDGYKHAHQTMKEIPQVPVIVDLVTDEDLRALAQGQQAHQVRQQRFARILDQAFAQGGVLAQSDLAAISLISAPQVSADLKAIRQTIQRTLPYRGSVQDIGGTISHKVEAIRLYEQGHLEPEICRLLSPEHSLRSVERYIQSYKNVIKLLERGFSPVEVSGILSMSERLVRAYVEIVREHYPDIIANNPNLCEKKLGSPGRSTP